MTDKKERSERDLVIPAECAELFAKMVMGYLREMGIDPDSPEFAEIMKEWEEENGRNEY